MARMHSFSTSALPSAIVSATSSVTSAITSATSAVTSATSAIASAVPTLPSAAPTALLSAILTALPALLLIRAASGQPDGYPIIEYPNCPITGQRPENIETAYIEASGVGPASIGAAVWQRRCTTEDNMTCCGLCGGEELALRYIRSNVSLAISALGANATAAARKLIDLSNPPSLGLWVSWGCGVVGELGLRVSWGCGHACEALQGYPLCAHLLEMVMCTAVCDADTEFVVEAGPTITICDGLAERLKAECAGTLFGRITITMDAYSFTTQLLTAIGRNLYGIPSFSAVISFSGGCLSGPPTDDAFPPTTTCCDPFTLHPSHCPPSSLPNPQTEPHPSSPLSPQPPTDLNRSNSNTSTSCSAPFL
ncbi:unnamed protein product [Closterium sp. NIES-64]|nr:unnamed protein product [Closterium sp. NIES-64]